MVRIIALLIGYAFGLFQTAYIYGKMKGIDIRNYGSGNAGTTNTLRVLGTKAALIVFAGDCLKTILAIVLVRLLFQASHPDQMYLLMLYAGAGAILAHDFPFYMQFKGGKGIACTAGLIIAFHPYFLIVGILLFFVPFLTTHYVSLGSLLVYAGFLIQMIISGELGVFGDCSRGTLIEMYVVTALLMALAYYQHRKNIVRLLKHEESKVYLFKKNHSNSSIE